MLEYLATTIVSIAGGGIGWIVTKYLVLPSKVEALQDDVSQIKADGEHTRSRVDRLYDHLIQR